MTIQTDRRDINQLLAKLYAELTRDLVAKNPGASEQSTIYQLHAGAVNAYYSADDASKPELARAVVEAFANVLTEPSERQQLKDAFQSETSACCFADGMASIFRTRAHRVLRPYEEPTAAVPGTLLGW